MQKVFHTSGFLYSLSTQQILLQQSNPETNSSSLWNMIGGSSIKNESAKDAFHRIVKELLKVELNHAHIVPVYNYFHTSIKKINYVFYAEIADMGKVKVPKGSSLSWFSFKQTIKLPFTHSTKQDIIVAERVIKLKERDIEEAAYQASKPH